MIKFSENKTVEYVSSGLFKSDGSWCHPRRIIDSYEIIFMYDGIAHICEGEKEYTLSENDILILHPGIEHYGFKASDDTVSFSWIHFVTDNEDYKNLPKHIHSKEPYILKTLFSQCFHVVNTPSYNPVCADLYVSLIIEEIINMIKTDDYRKNYLASEIKEWIRVNIDKDISVKKIAAHFGYHENHVSRVFKENYKSGLKDYIVGAKIDYAQNLLLTSVYSVKQISDMLSFENENLFVKFFKYHKKVTPTEYRNTYINKHINKA